MTVDIVVYIWAGSWGPFRIRSHCEECDVTWGLLKSMKDKEFSDFDVRIEKRPWLDNWWKCLRVGAWHAPIILVDEKKFFQFSRAKPIFSRQKLKEFVESKL